MAAIYDQNLGVITDFYSTGFNYRCRQTVPNFVQRLNDLSNRATLPTGHETKSKKEGPKAGDVVSASKEDRHTPEKLSVEDVT